jgi:hypothetical protein
MSDSVGVQEVRWDSAGTEPAGEYIFFFGKGNKNHELGIVFLRKRIISTVKRVVFFNDRMSYIIQRGRWCDTVLHVYAPIGNKTDDMNSFYKKLDRVFDKFPKYHMTIPLGDFNA